MPDGDMRRIESVVSLCVLVVDDDPDIRYLARRYLEHEDIVVVEAAGVDEMFASLDGGTEPDLILLDLTMPGASGWTAVSRLKGDPSRSEIPVVIFTAHDDAEFRAAAKSKGVSAYLTKPFESWELVDAVKRNVRSNRRSDPWAR
jgi:CheY-like chemotaxis protein